MKHKETVKYNWKILDSIGERFAIVMYHCI